MKMPHIFFLCLSASFSVVVGNWLIRPLVPTPKAIYPKPNIEFYKTFSAAMVPQIPTFSSPFSHYYFSYLKNPETLRAQKKTEGKLERYLVRNLMYNRIGDAWFERIAVSIPNFNSLLKKMFVTPRDAGRYWLGIAAQGILTLGKTSWDKWWRYQKELK